MVGRRLEQGEKRSVQPGGTLDLWPLWFKRDLPVNPQIGLLKP